MKFVLSMRFVSSHFDVVELRDADNEIHIELVEKNVISSGLNKCDNTIHTNHFDITRNTTIEEFVAFFKATN